MFQSLGARLIGICVAITALSLLALAVPTFLLVRSNTLESLDQRIHQLTQVYAGELTEWVREKQRITSSIKAAVPQAEPVPALLAAKQAGAFDDTYFVFADKRHVQPPDARELRRHGTPLVPAGGARRQGGADAGLR